jgi:rare lipoprotein A
MLKVNSGAKTKISSFFRVLFFLFLTHSLISCGIFYKSVPIKAWEDEMTGYASWYGKEYHGRKTSSGEIYDMYALTAAHRTLPLGSEVKVTNLENGRTVDVMINDRGPFIEDRVIDLSYSAAKAIGMLNQGTARVRLDLLKIPTGSDSAGYLIQAGSFLMYENALQLKNTLEKTCSPVFIETAETNERKYHRVRIGPIKDKDAAAAIRSKLEKQNINAYLMKVD